MLDFVEKIYETFKEFFLRLDPERRASFIGVAFFGTVILIGIIVWATKTRFEILYTDLNKDDVNKIASLLEDNNITYQIVSGGKTIKIPTDMINKWRLNIASMGVNLSGTVGYEVFDNQSFGTTSFVQKVNRQRALEGEMVKTIIYIRGVKRARVHLNIPESSPFVIEKKAPTASVVIELNRGVTLTENEIKGITQLISSSVDGMRPENVVILNDRGKKLSNNIGDPMTAYTANRVALAQKMNTKYEQQVEEILARVVGEGKVVAKVSIDLDYTQSISTETIYDQENVAVLSEVSNTQQLNGRRPSPQGIPGARSNLPGEEPQAGVPETTNNVNKKLVTKNFNVPSKVIKSKRPAAQIRKMSVAVMVDGKQVAALDKAGKPILNEDGTQKMIYEPWAEGDIQNFSEIVISALGISKKRGDHLVIKNMEFIKEDLKTVEAAMQAVHNRELVKNLVKYISIGLVMTLFFVFVVRPFIRWLTDNTVESVEGFLPSTLEELESVQANQKLPGLEDALPQIEEKLNPEKIEGNMLREKIVALIEANPAKASHIIHDMMHQKESDKAIA